MKKTYKTPSIKVVEIEIGNICAGSLTFFSDYVPEIEGGASALSKRGVVNDDLDDEEEDDNSSNNGFGY